MRFVIAVHRERRWFAIARITLLAICILALPGSAAAVGDTQSVGWSNLELIARNASAPLIVGDASGALHVFYVEGWYDPETSPQGQAVMYTHLRDGSWSDPVDILVSPIQTSISLDGAVIDSSGSLHLFWHDSQTLYHASAHVSESDNPQRWLNTPVLNGQIPLGDVVQDETGRLHLLVRPNPFSIGYMVSEDGGTTWSRLESVASVDDAEAFAVGGVQMAISATGTIHVTWFLTAKEVEWNFWSVWYTNSEGRAGSWAPAREMASPRFGASDIAVDKEDRVHLVYGRNINLPDGRWYQWSSDGGSTWFERRPLYPAFAHASGDTGGYSFSVDSAGALHLINSIGAADGEATAFHLAWQGDHWSQPVLIMGQHAHFPRGAVTLGNQLNFVALAGHAYELWFRSTELNAPSKLAEAIPTSLPLPQASAVDLGTEDTDTELLPGTESPLKEGPGVDKNSAPPTETRAVVDPLLVGGVSALAMVILAAFCRVQGRARGSM